MKKFLFALSCLLLFLGRPAAAEDFETTAKQAIAVDATTGKILYEKDAQTPAEIASITKTLTAYLVYEAIEEGKISLKTKVDISDYPYELTVMSGVANIPMEARNYSVQELLTAMMVASSNSAAIALAEKIAGSEPKFVDLMRNKLESWGIDDATIINASGLNNEYLEDHRYPGTKENDENKMSATDVAIIARHLILDYPEVLDITKQASAKFGGMDIASTNLMLEDMPNYRGGVDGLMTGSSSMGNGFVGTTLENDMQLITVVLGVENSEDGSDLRFSATTRLMSYVMRNFGVNTLIQKGDNYEENSVPIINGKKEKLTAVTPQDVTIIQKLGSQHAPKLTFTPVAESLKAPIKKGTQLGQLTYVDEELIGQGYLGGQMPHFDMVAEESVKRPFFIKAWWNDFVEFVNEKL